MPLSPRTLRPSSNWTPKSISGLALWLDASDSQSLYTTDAGAVTAVSSPTEIAGCALWLDGADSSAASVTLNGSLVEAWKDKSGNGRDFTATSTARPTLTPSAINSRSAVTFAGSLTTMTGNAAAQDVIRNLAGYTVIAAVRTASVAGGERFAFGVGSTILFRTGQQDSRPFIGGRRLYADTLESVTDGSGTLTTGTAFIQTAVVNHSSQSLTGIRNGAAFATDATYMAAGTVENYEAATSVGSQGGGTYGFWNGDIAEIVVFNTALSTADRARVEAYLAAKWGISGVHAQATATSDPVGAWLDKSGKARHATQSTAGSRPTISATTQNGMKALAFDGSNGWMRTERTTYAARSVFTVFRRTGTAPLYSSPFGKQSTVAAGYGGSSYAVAYGSEGGWSIVGSGTGRMNYSSNGSPHKLSAAYMRGAAMPLADAQNYLTGIAAAPNTTDAELLYAEAATDTDAGQAWFLGTEPFATTRKYPANILEVLIYNRALTATERLRIERYLAARWGITLAPQVSNADAQDWVNRVYANGGTVSSSTAAAVNTFCDAIDAASIRDRFYRMNLFAGGTSGTTAGLAACLVPLYRGPSLGGTQYGGTTDTNTGPFAVGDYAETGASGGLTGNGSSKFLKTGLTTSALPQIATGHLSVYASTLPTAAIYGLITSWGSGFADPIYAIEANRNGAGQLVTSWGNNFPAVNISSGVGTGLLMTSRTLGTSLKAYRNGSQIGTTSATSITPAANTGGGFGVFANAPQDGAGANWFPGRLAGYSIGAGMDDTQAAAFSAAMTTFQTALTRNV